MTDDEVVETSDPEELEELNAIAQRTWLSPKVRVDRVVTGPRQATHEVSNVESPPRKRAKISHSSPVVSVLPSVPQNSSPRSPKRHPNPSSHILRRILDRTVTLASEQLFEIEEDLGPGSEGSQDPLDFLHGYGTPTPRPNDSSSQINQRLFSSSPLPFDVGHHLSTPLSPRLPKSTPHSPQHPIVHATASCSPRASNSTPPRSTSITTGTSHDDYDDLFQFSPQKPRPANLPLSPLTPISSPRTDPPGPPEDHSSPHSPHSPPVILPAEREALEREGFDLAQNGSRYSFRTRSIRQVKPYEYDKALYQNQLRDNPDAIVKMRSPRDHHHRAREDQYEETQDQEYIHAEPDRPKTRSPSPENMSRLGLEQLSSSDDEDKEIRATRREWKRVERERRAREKREAAAAKEQRREKRANTPIASRHTSLDIVADAATPSSPFRNVRSLSPDRANPHSASPPPHSLASASGSSSAPGGPDLFHDDDDQIPFNAYDSPIVIEDDPVSRSPSPATEPTPDRSASTSGSDSEDDLNSEDRKRMRVLKRMYPAFMLGKIGSRNIAGKNGKSRRQSSAVLSGSEAEEVNLLPGQSRFRIAKQPRSNSQILGDSESSDDERFSPKSESEGDNDNGDDTGDLPQIVDGDLFDFETVHGAPDVIEISDTSDDEVVHEDDHGHAAQQPLSQPKRRVVLKEMDIIDYMLDGERRRPTKSRKRHPASSTSVRRTSRRRRSSSVYHPATGHRSSGKRRERQTRLTVHRSTKPTSSRHRPANDYQSSDSDVEFLAPDTRAEPRIQHINKEKAAKEKKKRREQHRDKNGLYIFTAAKGTRITNGSRKRSYNVSLNIDLTDEDFNNALAPSSQGGFDRRIAAPRKPRRDVSFADSEPQIEIGGLQHGSSHPGHPTKFPVDVPLLSQGISFPRDTYVGKGWLFELIHCQSSDSQAPNPTHYSFQGITLAPDMSTSQVAGVLPKIWEGLFNFAVDIPDMDSDVTIKGWNGLARTASLHLSRQLRIGTEDSAGLCAVVQDEISRLLEKTHTPEFIATSTEIPALNLCWLAVEWSVRLGFRLPLAPEDSNLLLKSITRLVQCLARYGLQRSMASIPDSGTFETVTTATRTVELWTCVFHVADTFREMAQGPNNRVHPFWQAVEQVLISDLVGATHLQVSEWIWSTVSSLCALSQFSVHGATTSAPQAPAAWKIVATALKTICLVENKVRDAALQEESKVKRDQYIGTVVRRCFQLWSRCHWKLDDVSPTLTHLADVFRSRHFANLRHEKSNFPGFMRHNDLSMLSQVQKHDSAFVLFLKLIVQFARESIPLDSSALPMKVKKFLSLAVPVGTLAFSKRCPPSANDLSMLHNRHIATVIAIYLDPEDHARRVAQARSYVKFDEADFGTRLVVIQALMHYSRIMVALKLPLTEVAEWLRAVVSVVVDEYNPAVDHKNDTVLPVQTVLRCVRRILQVYNDPATRDYPEPELLLCIAKIVRNSKLRQESWIGMEIVDILSRFFDARTSVMPPPERPLLPSNIESQESQDEYGMFDLDMNDPDLLAALGEISRPTATRNFKSQDQALFRFLHEVSWIPYQLLKRLASSPGSKVDDLDRCIMTWLRCASVVVRNSNDKNWESYLKLLDAIDNHGDGYWNYYVCLEGLCCILQLDPMIYPTQNNKFLEAMLECLVPISVTVEHRFLSQLLSIDGCRHPLLEDVPFQPKDDGDYHISQEDFILLRPAFVKGIFYALNSRLLDQNLAIENELFVGYCIKLFSRMRSSYSSLEPGSESLRGYEATCREVTQEFLQQPLLCSHKRLDYWLIWSRGIGSPSR